jgi:hypothetical protein
VLCRGLTNIAHPGQTCSLEVRRGIPSLSPPAHDPPVVSEIHFHFRVPEPMLESDGEGAILGRTPNENRQPVSPPSLTCLQLYFVELLEPSTADLLEMSLAKLQILASGFQSRFERRWREILGRELLNP